MNKNKRISLSVHSAYLAVPVLAIVAIAALFLWLKSPIVGAAEEETAAHEVSVPEDVVPFTDDQIQKYGVTVSQAAPGTLRTYIQLPGEIRLDADQVTRVVLPVTGYAQEIEKNLGDSVTKGETMATFKSRELADARTAYVAAQSRLGLAQTALKREKSLYEQKVSPQQDMLDAERDAAETRIAMRAAEQQLRTLGYDDADFKSIASQSNETYARFVLQSPMNGRVIEKHITRGELIAADATAFIVAELEQLWADFTVTQQDLGRVRAGQQIAITSDAIKEPVEATIAYLGPIVSSGTRTALARAVIDNTNGVWIPGQFATGKILVDTKDAPVLIPQAAIQTVDGMPSVFVKVAEGFVVRPIKMGRSADDGVEVLSGLNAGETFASAGSFVIKAQLGKGEAGHEEE